MVRLCHLRLFLLFSLNGVALGHGGHGGYKGKGAKLESKKPCNNHKINVDVLESDNDFDFLNQLLPVFNFGFGKGAFNKGRRGGCSCQLTTPSPREVCPNNVTMNVTNGQHGWWRGMEMRRYRPNKKSISLKEGCPVRVPLPPCPEKLKDRRTRRSPHHGGGFRKGNYFRRGNNDGSSSEEDDKRSAASRGKMYKGPNSNQRRCIDQKSKETKVYYIQDVSTVFMTATVTSNVYVTNSRDIEERDEEEEGSSVQFSINTSPVESSTGVVSGILPTGSTQYTFTETSGGFSNGQQDDWSFGRKRWTSMDSGTYSSEAWSSTSKGQGELPSSSVFNQVSRDSSGTRGSDSKSSSSSSKTNGNQGSNEAWSSTRGLDELSTSSSSVNQNGRETSRSRESDAVLSSKTTYQVSSSWSSTYLVGGAQDSATRAPFSTAISSAFSSSTRKESDYSTQIQQSSQSRGNNNDRENYGRIPGGESQTVEETEETMPTTTSSYARRGTTRITVTSSTTNIESSFSQASSTKSSSADRTDTSRVVTSSTQPSSSSSSISSSDSLSPTISSISSPSSPTTSSTAFTSAATTSSIASTSPPVTFSVASSSSPTTYSFVSKSSPIDTTSASTSTITTQSSKRATNRETDTTQTSTISSRSSYFGLMDILEKEKISSTSKTSPSAQTTASISDAPSEITSRSRWEVQTTSEKKTSKETIAVTESPKLKIETTPKISPIELETRPVVFSTEKATRDSTTAEIKSVARTLTTTRATDNDNNESVKRESTALKVETSARTESTRAISAAETTQKSITSEPEITRAPRTTPVPISQSEATRRSRWDSQASTQQETTTSYSREDAEKRKSTMEQSREKNENSSSSGSSNNNLEALVNGGRKIEPTESTGRDSKESERKEIALQGNNTTFDNKQQTVIQKSGAKNTSTGDDVADAASENRKYVYYLLFGNSNCMCNEKNNKTGLNQTEPEQTDAQGVSWKQQGFPDGDGGQFYIGYKGKNGTQERVRGSIVEVKVSHADFNCTSMFAPLFGN
ncbi:serine-rich adhesin for platelets-like [Neocloeon triangulifer]|uniref:serine-rich adhesin for platelets-like n=1 Tax=Neocloeon triangulifer TaxID=2078957 RepID=UPI00286FAD9F|nr:serine-rich adhesin for platelets-like [Neocloeon triangulifer]